MPRFVTLAASLLVGALLGALLVFVHFSDDPEEATASGVTLPESGSRTAAPVVSRSSEQAGRDEIDELLAGDAHAAAEREMLFEQLQELALRLDAVVESVERLSAPQVVELPAAAVPDPTPAAPAQPQPTPSVMQAYLDAGLDPLQVEDIQRRQADLEMQRLYLRDQAIREGWMDSDQYRQRLRELESASGDLRAELGDEAFDRYLYASDRPNRIRVQSLIDGSPAAEAGVRAGDVILSYGEQRILLFGDLTRATTAGEAGTLVRVRLQRGDSRLDVFVPRGPLGVRLGSLTMEP